VAGWLLSLLPVLPLLLLLELELELELEGRWRSQCQVNLRREDERTQKRGRFGGAGEWRRILVVCAVR